LQPFLVDNERGKTVSIRLGERQQKLDPSAANGHLYGSFRLSTDEADQLLGDHPGGPGWGNFRAVTSAEDKRKFSGRIQFVPQEGLSVISDIDDTIKNTRVTERGEMLANTFTRKFRAVKGMAGLYKQAADQGVVFHYVSGSPWQLYEPLAEFFADVGFPAGSFHLKYFRVKDSTLFDLFASQEATKIKSITAILDAFPRRRFILVGDSGEQDPEIYGRIARASPDRIAGIFIRKVSDTSVADNRLATAFRDIDAETWHAFTEADEIKEAFMKLVPQQ
jgi:phosphatidate phosphatase APP1